MKGNGDTSWGGAGKNLPETAGDMVSRFRNDSTGARLLGFDELCRRYWKPIYVFIRTAWAKSNEDAKDLTQAFFLWLFEGEALKRYAPERAAFRTFLKSLLRHFLADQDKSDHRLKRGGGARPVDLDGVSDDLLADPRAASPEEAFDLAWRRALVARAVEQVRARFAARGQTARFQAYESYDLASPEGRPTYAEIAARLQLKESDVLHALSDAREQVRAAIRAELESMTSGPDELEEEWNAFLGT